jgi:hypothetical protein
VEQLALDVPPSDSRGALLSDDELHRHFLWRRWGDGLLLGYVMLNPSKADATLDDQTIRQCCYFAQREGFAGIYVVNLFSCRATQQSDLWAFRGGLVSPENDQHIAAAILNERIGMFIAAWGALPELARHRQYQVRTMFQDGGRDLHCFGFTKKGWPRHPARLGHSAEVVPFPHPLRRG